MARLPLPLCLLLLVALGPSTASAVPASPIFARETCAVHGFESCGKNFPDSFCCQKGTKCLSLAGGTTTVCCPNGATCDNIEPIPCNAREQDPKEKPSAAIKTSVFDVNLPKCGNACCPFGYSCTGGEECRKDRDQSERPKADKPSSTVSTATGGPAAKPSETSPATATGTEAPITSATSDESESKPHSKDSGPDTTSIIGGVVGACAILLIVAVVLFICVRKRAKRKPEVVHARSKHGGSNVAKGWISDPISLPHSYRADFMRRGTYDNSATDKELGASGSSPSMSGANRFSSNRLTRLSLRPGNSRLSIPNRFATSPNPSCAETASRASTASWGEPPPRTGHVAGARLAPIRAMKASSRHIKAKSRHLKPETAYQRQPSCENINVFADPSTVDERGARETRFTDLMDEADLGEVRKGKPYVPGTTPRI